MLEKTKQCGISLIYEGIAYELFCLAALNMKDATRVDLAMLSAYKKADKPKALWSFDLEKSV